jgi:hypothetical protein
VPAGEPEERLVIGSKFAAASAKPAAFPDEKARRFAMRAHTQGTATAVVRVRRGHVRCHDCFMSRLSFRQRFAIERAAAHAGLRFLAKAEG